MTCYSGQMIAKAVAILLLVVLGCHAYSAHCKHAYKITPSCVVYMYLLGSVMPFVGAARPGSRELGHNAIWAGSKLNPGVLCIKNLCSGEKLSKCFCCATLPDDPCWDTAQECRKHCPSS